MIVPPTDDDILVTLDECGYRWVAWRRALAHAGPRPAEDDWFALIELEMAADRWLERFHAILARRGWTLDDVLEPAA